MVIATLVAHSYPVVRAGLRAALSATSSIELLAEASEGEEALCLIRKLRPTVALVACRLQGGLDGADVAEAAGPGVRIIGLNGKGDEGLVYRMLKARAAGCLAEWVSLDGIVRAVEAVARGESLWMREQIRRAEQWWDEVGCRLAILSAREMQILDLLVQARTNRQIAADLGVTENTVETHLRNLYGKLRLHTRQEVMLFCLHAGVHGLLRSP